MKAHRANPRLTAGWLNRLFFCWLIPIFKEGNRHRLAAEDLYDVLPENRSQPVTDRLEKFWNDELLGKRDGDASISKDRKPSLFRAIRRTFLRSFLVYGVHSFFLHLVCKMIQPYLLGQLILHFDESTKDATSTSEAYGYATAFVLVVVLDNALFSHIMYGLRSVGISARVACASLLYRKIMRLPDSAKQASGGKIVNLLSNDSAKLEISFLFSHTLWILPLQTLLVTYLICRGIGYLAGLAAVLALVCQTVPVQSFSGRLIARFRRRIAAKTDERLLLTDEIVRGIRVIKMYTWEKAFEQLVSVARRHEIDVITASSYLKSMLWAALAFAQRTPLFIAVTLHVLQTGGVTAYTLFTMLQYFSILHVTMGSYFLRSVSILSEAAASLERMQHFLLLDEKAAHVKYLQANNMDDAVVSLNSVSASTSEKPGVDVLRDLQLDLRQRTLYAVVGAVGAGKSSLLKLILDELKPSKGQVIVYGSASYASQEPWIFKASVRENILFGEAYDPKRYDEVVRVCALERDLEQLSEGDETIVGEGGSNLSGGQCARINLARAVYKEADIYLLDDPFSAVDGRVGRTLFDECVNGLLRSKTRVLVSHQVQYLRNVDEVVLVNDGRIEFQGGFEKLEKNSELFEYLNALNEADATIRENEEVPTLAPTIENVANGEVAAKETEKLLAAKPATEKQDERKAQYWKYFTASGSAIFPLATILAFVGSQLICCGCDYFVAYWTRQSASALDSYTAIYVFAGFTAAIIALSIVKMALFTATCRKSNERIHNDMVASLLRASVRFFDANDSGRILNRFSKDLGTVDERLQGMMLEALEYVLTVVGVALQIVVINRWSALLMGLMSYLYWKSREVMIRTTRNIMRLEAQAKSPVFAHVKSSIDGIVTIRSRRAQPIACREFDARQDDHTSAAAISQYALVAYNYWLDWTTLVLIVFLTYGFVLFEGTYAGADVGLAMTQMIVLCGVLARGIKLSGDIETQMVSVERLFEYTQLEREQDGGERAPSGWPANGEIVFELVSLRYDAAPVLREVEFTVEAGAKVGIVGRTGAGKSSLITALFRLADREGVILIDGVDTKKLSLHELRGNMSILPQEPILFSASLRKNLDPRGEFDDATLWTALRDVELSNAFDSLDRTLEQGNLSAGQKQLLCLARTILRRCKILILDEVTANVDPNTAALIQRTIRAKFKDCTVLMIAHRLSTVMDCDRILAMDRGRVLEYDSPAELMKRNDGYFAGMVRQCSADREVPKVE